MRVVVAAFFLLLGATFPGLRNGQTFTHDLLAIAAFSAAVALALRPARDTHIPRGGLWAARAVVGLGVLMAALLISGLPSSYRFQVRFNRAVELRKERSGARATWPTPGLVRAAIPRLSSEPG